MIPTNHQHHRASNDFTIFEFRSATNKLSRSVPYNEIHDDGSETSGAYVQRRRNELGEGHGAEPTSGHDPPSRNHRPQSTRRGIDSWRGNPGRSPLGAAQATAPWEKLPALVGEHMPGAPHGPQRAAAPRERPGARGDGPGLAATSQVTVAAEPPKGPSVTSAGDNATGRRRRDVGRGAGFTVSFTRARIGQ